MIGYESEDIGMIQSNSRDMHDIKCAKMFFTLRIVWTCWFKDSFRSAILAGIKFDNDWAGGLIFEEFLRALSDILTTQSWWQGSLFVTNIEPAEATLLKDTSTIPFLAQNYSELIKYFNRIY